MEPTSHWDFFQPAAATASSSSGESKDALQALCDLVGIPAPCQWSEGDAPEENAPIKAEFQPCKKVKTEEEAYVQRNCPFESANTNVKVESCPSPVTESRSDDIFLLDWDLPALDSPAIPSDLKTALKRECQDNPLPVDLFQSTLFSQSEPVLARETNLFSRLSKLQPYQPERVRELQDFYKYQTALVETDRYRSLMLDSGQCHMKRLLNQYYDQELGLIIDRV